METKHKVAPTAMATLWDLVKKQLEHPVAMFVRNGIKPRRGEKKKDAEMEVWMEVVKSTFAAGVELGYDMGMTVAGAPDPEPIERCAKCGNNRSIDGKADPKGCVCGGG